jgi:tRNA A-37 threonylcarbamoyl transferase component Bud32
VTADPPLLQPADLCAAGRELTVPFALSLSLRKGAASLRETADGRLRLVCRRILRLLPGRRLVALVDVGGRPAVMKLFLGTGAARYRDREYRGCALMAGAGVATPAVLGELDGTDAGGSSACALLFEYLPEARPVSAGDDARMAAAAGELARLHRAGCRHHDLHLDNFLERPGAGRVFVIDGDRVRLASARPLNVRRSLEDLAVLCAQRPPPADESLGRVLGAYATHRRWPEDEGRRLTRLAAATRRQRRRRVGRFLLKAQRDCTEFHQHRSWRRWVIAVREVWGEAPAQFAADPEAFFRHGRILKAGNSATVVRADIGERTWVIKRYNLKGPWHAVRRALKPMARFRLAWLNGQRLHFLGIPTARPVMLVERRFGPLRRVAYLVMEDLGDRDLGREIAAQGLSEARLAQLVALFRALNAAELCHGDTKASNFLVAAGSLHLIDLDAMRVCGRGDRDVARFLGNFEHLPEVRERIRAALAGPGAGGGFARPYPPL